MTSPATIVVLDGEQRAALAVVRSLGRQGYAIHLASATAKPLAGASKFAISETLLPDPHAGSRPYASAVADLANRVGADRIIPVAESSTLAVLEHREMFGDSVIPTATLDSFRRACDKHAVLATASTLGIAVPAQRVIAGPPTLSLDLPSELFPAVVKPIRSVAGEDGARRKVGVHYARTAEDVRLIQYNLGESAGPFLVQTRIHGPGMGIFLLRWNGHFLARFAHRRLREKPPSGGVSVACESLAPPAQLLAQSESLLSALDWQGVAMIEYKVDAQTGIPYLMEVNPRFWGSLQLAVDAGVDFPAILAAASMGREYPAPDNWRVGVRLRWYLGGIDHLIARTLHSRADLALSDTEPGWLPTAAAIFTPYRPRQRGEVFRFDDPGPGARELVSWLQELWPR